MLGAIRTLRIQLDHEGHAVDSLRTMQTLKALGRPSIPRDVLTRISNDLARDDRTSFREFLQSVLLFDRQRDAHIRRGVSPETANALMATPAVTYIYALAIGVLALEWTFKGGIESASQGRVANDILDVEYLIAALWVGRLVTRDAGARDHLEDLKVLGATWWPSHAEWFARIKALDSREAISRIVEP
jgi:hypothetical protein